MLDGVSEADRRVPGSRKAYAIAIFPKLSPRKGSHGTKDPSDREGVYIWAVEVGATLRAGFACDWLTAHTDMVHEVDVLVGKLAHCAHHGGTGRSPARAGPSAWIKCIAAFASPSAAFRR